MGVARRELSDEEHETEMARLSEMIEKGIHLDIAVAAALDHCDRHGRPVPQWLVGPAARLTCRLLNDKSPRPAKNATPSALYIKDMRDWIRWDSMDEITEARRHIRQEIKALKTMAISKRRTTKHVAALKNQRANLRQAGSQWEDALKLVSAQLKGTYAEAGEEMIKKSYLKVENTTGVAGLHYYRFDKSFLDRIAVDIAIRKQE
jgi:hypothetical protein